MLVELRFEQLKPRSVPEYQAAFERAAKAPALAPLAGFWRTEVGDIDSVVQLWQFDGAAAREAALAGASALADVERQQRALVMTQDSLLLAPAPFSPPVTEQALGGIYELRIYTYEPGSIPRVIDRWAEKIAARTKLSPLVFCGYSTAARMNQWVHLWAYQDALQRQQIRAEAMRLKLWPPDAREGLIVQRNMLLVPAGFSRLR